HALRWPVPAATGRTRTGSLRRKPPASTVRWLSGHPRWRWSSWPVCPCVLRFRARIAGPAEQNDVCRANPASSRRLHSPDREVQGALDVPSVSAGRPEDVFRDRAELRAGFRQALRRRARRRRSDRHDLAGEGRPADPRALREARYLRAQAPRGGSSHLAVLRSALLREGPAPGREDRLPPPAFLLL